MRRVTIVSHQGNIINWLWGKSFQVIDWIILKWKKYIPLFWPFAIFHIYEHLRWLPPISMMSNFSEKSATSNGANGNPGTILELFYAYLKKNLKSLTSLYFEFVIA